MQFFTKISIAEASIPINYQSKIVSLGSCFAENMSEKLHFFQFQNKVNPFGIVFNSTSIEKLVSRATQNHVFTDEDVFFHNERWHCFEVHSDLSHTDKDFFLDHLNQTLKAFSNDVLAASHLIITLGTSWVYKTIACNEIVANCHKIPQKKFSKHLLSTAEISASLENIVTKIKEVNPNCAFIFTISPVRHIKDGFVENQISKANLIAAVYDLTTNQRAVPNINYFPSYEIMMDELRDYRFYNQDLLHPNQTAIDYIWSKFVESNIEKSSFTTMTEVESIQKDVQHRSLNPDSLSHKKFLEKLTEKIQKLKSVYPFMHF